MDYETPDGSRFSLAEVFDDGNDFSYTSVSAFVQGEAFAGKVDSQMHDVDDSALLSCLKPVPVENIYPIATPSMTIIHDVDARGHYAKSPLFAYEDIQPGQTFVARCFEREIMTYELLRQNPHPRLAKYFGCISTSGRITRIILKKYARDLFQWAETGTWTTNEADVILEDVFSAVEHLHALGIAHNDLDPANICIDDDGHAILIDLDSCLPFGDKLLKGVAPAANGKAVSCKENDWVGLGNLGYWLRDIRKSCVT